MGLREVLDALIREGRRIRCLQHMQMICLIMSPLPAKPGILRSRRLQRQALLVTQETCGCSRIRRPCTRGFKTHVSSVSHGRQSIYNKALAAIGGSKQLSGISSRIASAVAASAWTGCGVATTQHRSNERAQKTAEPPRGWPR